jgi:MT-A70 protein
MSTLALCSDARAPIIAPEVAPPLDVLPTGHVFAGLKPRQYRCVLVDPPTRFIAGTKGRPQHYDRLGDREIAALPVAYLLHPKGAWIFLWVTSPKFYPISRQMLSPADIVRPWSARYSARAFVWVKTKRSTVNEPPDAVTGDSLHRGMGYFSRLVLRSGWLLTSTKSFSPPFGSTRASLMKASSGSNGSVLDHVSNYSRARSGRAGTAGATRPASSWKRAVFERCPQKPRQSVGGSNL